MRDDSDSLEFESDESEVEEKRMKLANGKKQKAGKSKLKRALTLATNGANGGTKVTVKEINKLKETQLLYHSNLQRFQIQELLRETSISKQQNQFVNTWFDEFKIYVTGLDESETYEVGLLKKLIGRVKVPLQKHALPKKSDNWDVTWEKPNNVEIIGSWSIGTAIAKLSMVDILVEMPSTYLKKSDHLNLKYYQKRAIYLCYLGICLANRGDHLKFSLLNEDPLKPVLIIDSTIEDIKIRIIPAPPQDFFNVSKLLPEKNNFRYQYYFMKPLAEGEAEDSTPNYNAGIMADMMMKPIHMFTKEIFDSCPNLAEAVKLLKIWLEQRSLNKGFGKFSNFLATMFIAYLYKKEKINSNLSSYQMIRIAFVHLSQNTDWTKTGIGFKDENLKDFLIEFSVVFLDESGRLNFASDMSKCAFNRIKLESSIAIKTMDSSDITSFSSMFMKKVNFFENFDHILQILDFDKLKENLKMRNMTETLELNYVGNYLPIVSEKLFDLIEQTLGERQTLIDIQPIESIPWDLGKRPSKITPTPTIRVGLLINREHAYKISVKCESECYYTVYSFREFWGEISQLRRFKDGSMFETVIFDKDKKRVPYEMLKYTFKKFYNYDLTSNEYLDVQFDSFFEPKYTMKLKEKEKVVKNYKGKSKNPYAKKLETKIPVAIEEINSAASISFDQLSRILRDLEGLPLGITSVQGTSSILRHTNVFPSPPQRFFSSKIFTQRATQAPSCVRFQDKVHNKMPKYIEPINIVLHLESSGKWPDDLKTIDHLKCAFLLRIGQLLTEQFDLTVQTYPKYLDVLKDGFVFRIKLTYLREIILLKQLREDGVLKIRENPDSLYLERECLLLPQLTSTLHAFELTYPAFGKTCRLAKRWVSSHLLMASRQSNPHVPQDFRLTEEAIELFVASHFISPTPYLSSPNEGQIGFMRFLHSLAFLDWSSTPLILNFNSKLSKDEITKIESEFTKNRATKPPLFIATPEDKSCSSWTKNLTPFIFHRIQVLAKMACEEITNQFNSLTPNSELNLKMLFRPSLKQFDFVIWIEKDMNSRRGLTIDENKDILYQEYIKTKGELMPIVDFDPVQLFISELQESFGHLAAFLHDFYCPNFIALIWKPAAGEPQDFKPSTVKGKSLNSKGNLQINIAEIIESIRILGKGIVNRIEANKEGWDFQ